jgi:precorrin-6B methylase 2
MFIFFLIILQIILPIIILFLLGLVIFIMFSFRDIIPFVPTPRKMIGKMIELADIKDNEKIVDLGSGTGRIIIKAAKRHKKNLLVGIEKSFTLRSINKFFLFFHPYIKKRVQIVHEDLFNADLQQFKVIFCFLTPEALRILTPKFKLLPAGTRIISYMFPIEDYQGFVEYTEYVTSKDSIYFYKKI